MISRNRIGLPETDVRLRRLPRDSSDRSDAEMQHMSGQTKYTGDFVRKSKLIMRSYIDASAQSSQLRESQQDKVDSMMRFKQ